MMTKYPQGRKRFGRRRFKQRYFRLTTKTLSYAKSKGKQPICDIPLSEIERVEQLNEKSFKMQNCFKVSGIYSYTYIYNKCANIKKEDTKLYPHREPTDI